MTTDLTSEPPVAGTIAMPSGGEDALPDAATTPRWRRQYKPVGSIVDKRAGSLQHRAAQGAPEAIAALARLRRGAGKEPGDVLDILEYTLPESYSEDGSEPTPEERATHVALTLFALHQQSRSEPMHRRGVGLGTALRQLGGGTEPPEAIQRRFRVLGTADSFAELTHHLRGAVALLRAASISLDYARLADQLVDYQHPGGPQKVRLQWGREFYRTERPTSPDAESATPTDAS